MDENKPAPSTLERMPERGVSFLNAVGRHQEIYDILAAHGYSQQEHDLGFELLRKTSTLNPLFIDLNTPAGKAIAELDQWDEPHFNMASAALRRLHPPQNRFVFNNLKPDKGYAAVLAVTTFLDRLDLLGSSPDREKTRDADAAALATLAKRGIDDKERARLRALITIATAAPAAEIQTAKAKKREDARLQALLDLYNWHNDWSSTAHSFIRRRSHLIALGLASRRKSKSKNKGPEDGSTVS